MYKESLLNANAFDCYVAAFFEQVFGRKTMCSFFGYLNAAGNTGTFHSACEVDCGAVYIEGAVLKSNDAGDQRSRSNTNSEVDYFVSS